MSNATSILLPLAAAGFLVFSLAASAGDRDAEALREVEQRLLEIRAGLRQAKPVNRTHLPLRDNPTLAAISAGCDRIEESPLPSAAIPPICL